MIDVFQFATVEDEPSRTPQDRIAAQATEAAAALHSHIGRRLDQLLKKN